MALTEKEALDERVEKILAIDKKKFIVVEQDKEGNDLEEMLVVGLDRIHKDYAPRVHIIAFHDRVIEDGPATYGVMVREATKEDLEVHQQDESVFQAILDYKNFKEYMAKQKAELCQTVAVSVQEKVKTEDHLKVFLTTHGLTTSQLQSILKRASPEVYLSDEWVGMFAEHVSKKSKGTTNVREVSEVISSFRRPLSVD